MAAAKLLGVVPSYMKRVAEKFDLSVYTDNINGGDANYYLLDELRELRTGRRFGGATESALTAKPTEFVVKRERQGE